MSTQLFSVIFLLACAIYVCVLLWLNQRQKQTILRAYNAVPSDFKDKISLKEHQKAGDYTTTKLTLNGIEVIVAIVMALVWTVLGGIEAVNSFWQSYLSNPLWLGTLVMMSILLISGLIDLPFSVYRHFVIEARFGFNKMNAKTFITDLIKQLLLFFVLLTPIFYFMLFIMTNLNHWWFYLWLTLMAISVVSLWLYPAFIAPLFNKFSALDDENLSTRIKALLKKTGFHSDGIFVMDGSKRSSHGNAYFSGIGKNKRIVFFDTLLKTMNHDEIIAILAHELGHFHHKHIRKQLLINAVITLVSLYLLFYVSDKVWFYQGLGIESVSQHIVLMLFIIIYPIFTLFMTPVLHALSRKHEYQADAFAAQNSKASDLITALVKLYKENSATLTPDDYYSLVHDSHPSASLRINHLRQL